MDIDMLKSENIPQLHEWIKKNFRDIFNGERYRNFSFEKAFNAVKFAYQLKRQPAPFLVVCENPLEAQLIKNAMDILYKRKDETFLNLFNQCKNLARAKNIDYEILEKASNALFEYTLTKCVVFVEENIRNGKWKHLLLHVSEKILTPIGISADHNYFVRAFPNLGQEPASTNFRKLWQHHIESCLMVVITCRDVAVASKYPKCFRFNGNRLLHSIDSPAVEFGYSHPIFDASLYFINGRIVHNKTLITNGFTYQDFVQTENARDRAVMLEIINEKGAEAILNFFNLEEVDRKVIKHHLNMPMFNAFGEYVGDKEVEEEETLILYRTKEKFRNIYDPRRPFFQKNRLAWIRFVCPSTGTNYMIQTSPSFRNAIDAAKASRAFNTRQSYAWMQRS